MKKLVFNSVTSIYTWAGHSQGHRFGDAWYVQKDNLYYYFGVYPVNIGFEYRLVMTSERSLGE